MGILFSRQNLTNLAIGEKDQKIQAVKNALEKLPKVHLKTLAYLMGHWAQVAKNQSVNKVFLYLKKIFY